MKRRQFRGQVGHPEHGFGFRPDPVERRGCYASFGEHFLAAGFRAAALPRMTRNVAHAPVPWNQSVTGSCLGHGFACQVTTTFAARGGPLSSPVLPRWVYAVARIIDRSGPSVPLADVGAYPNSAVRALGRWGCVLSGEDDGGRTAESSDYEAYLVRHVNDEPKLGELEKAGRRILVGFNAIGDVDGDKLVQFQQALASKHAVGVAVDAGNDVFQGYQELLGPLDYCGSDPDHWICVLDYAYVDELRRVGELPAGWEHLQDDLLLFLVQNSWGRGLWTASGRAWVTADFVRRGCFNSLVTNLGV